MEQTFFVIILVLILIIIKFFIPQSNEKFMPIIHNDYKKYYLKYNNAYLGFNLVQKFYISNVETNLFYAPNKTSHVYDLKTDINFTNANSYIQAKVLGNDIKVSGYGSNPHVKYDLTTGKISFMNETNTVTYYLVVNPTNYSISWTADINQASIFTQG